MLFRLAEMTSQAREQLRAELTSLVQRRRADYLRLKGAGREITDGELSEARAAYERALVRLSRFLEQARGKWLGELFSDRECPPDVPLR